MESIVNHKTENTIYPVALKSNTVDGLVVLFINKDVGIIMKSSGYPYRKGDIFRSGNSDSFYAWGRTSYCSVIKPSSNYPSLRESNRVKGLVVLFVSKKSGIVVIPDKDGCLSFGDNCEGWEDSDGPGWSLYNHEVQMPARYIPRFDFPVLIESNVDKGLVVLFHNNHDGVVMHSSGIYKTGTSFHVVNGIWDSNTWDFLDGEITIKN